MSKFTKEHYKDVATLLRNEHNDWVKPDYQVPVKQLMLSFANLFAADNPPGTHCWRCGSNRNFVVPSCRRPNEEHNYGGFDREQFLAACGLESKRAEPRNLGFHQ